jgi:hypothetical protein
MGISGPGGSEEDSMRLAVAVNMFTVASESPKNFEVLAIFRLCASRESGRPFSAALLTPPRLPNNWAIAQILSGVSAIRHAPNVIPARHAVVTALYNQAKSTLGPLARTMA